MCVPPPARGGRNLWRVDEREAAVAGGDAGEGEEQGEEAEPPQPKPLPWPIIPTAHEVHSNFWLAYTPSFSLSVTRILWFSVLATSLYQLPACVQHSILISLKIQGLDGIAGVPNYLHELVICPENEE